MASLALASVRAVVRASKRRTSSALAWRTVVALLRWGDKWVRPDGGRIAFTHADCGAPIEVDVRCAKGHPVSIEDVKAGVRRPASGH